METQLKKIVEKLITNNETISSMESCTGGGFANALTNIEGVSDAFRFSAITYSNEYKIKMGVDSSIIDTYSVYSIEIAKEMSKKISEFSNSTYGIGITGKLNRSDKNNLYSNDSKVYISIYNSLNDEYYLDQIIVIKDNRQANKQIVIDKIITMLEKILVI